MWYLRKMYVPAIALTVIILVLFFLFRAQVGEHHSDRTPILYVLSYTNFTKNWGPGPDIAKSFEARHGIKVRWIEASNAGMMTEYLSNDKGGIPADVVLGLDLLSLEKARQLTFWETFSLDKYKFAETIFRKDKPVEFVPFDWAPLTFIYKRQTGAPPRKLEELKGQGFNSLRRIHLRAPPACTLVWVLSIGEGFSVLELKPSVRVISPSWSAYNLFKNDQAPYVFSFFTSLYHHSGKNTIGRLFRRSARLRRGVHGFQVVPQCEKAKAFVMFLLEPENQKNHGKNFMLPVIRGVKTR